jgi:hypothetical protein
MDEKIKNVRKEKMESKKLKIFVVDDEKYPQKKSKEIVDALTRKGCLIDKIDFKEMWKSGDESLLPEYDVIISDLGFPTDYRIGPEDKELILKNAIKYKELVDLIKPSKNYTTNGWKEKFERYKDINDIINNEFDWLVNDEEHKKHWGDYYESSEAKTNGFVPVARAAKQLGKKISFFTNDLSHAAYAYRFHVGLGLGIFTPEELASLINNYNARWDDITSKQLVTSDNLRLMMGFKEERMIHWHPEDIIFGNWIKAIETAIKYQTKDLNTAVSP